MKKFILATLCTFALISCSKTAWSQDPPMQGQVQEQKCEGPEDLCKEILDLKAKLDNQKAQSRAERSEEHKKRDKDEQDRMLKLITVAGIISAALKTFISALNKWKDYFTTDKGKAILKAITLLTGFVAFIFTNIGFGIPWWQALIVAGGGPGAILLHEMMKLLPAIKGKGALPPDDNSETKKLEDQLPSLYSSTAKSSNSEEDLI